MTKESLLGAVRGVPNVVLRLEGAVVFAGSIAVFSQHGQAWWLYPVLLLTPDIFMIGYLKNTKLGSITYNIGHAYPAAAAVLVTGLLTEAHLVAAIGAIWFGHIGWDRMFGYGLKYATSFKHTHLGDLDKSAK